ncbi:biopolymer transport protein ExbD [Catalinimonas alkaloidigena]|uniref:ExbD/TolR family protein n=1 Tax=Catalinimonas alkaloidigena TaxID=1075417 RepID=UPI002406F333|nr:biopolymer transporter ExbD [Catalinimonas alkaloidigena]MDF9797199.1 biopolymer transport protein ExbD [Catalinimonas alkaloidigena]
MNLDSKHKIETSFNFSSIADIIFLLLIFFMLTSSFVTPSGLPVNLPSSKSSNIVMQKVSVTITPDIRFYINDKLVPSAQLEAAIASSLSQSEQGVVVLNVDKSVPVEHLVKVAGIASSLNAKVSVATIPE